jgi:hypothetical protein
MWGVVNSNFSGSNGVLLNPSSIVTSKLYMDINLVTADIFVDNNYAYIHGEDYSLTKYLTKNPEWPKYGPDEMAFDHYTNKMPAKDAYINVFAKGPSFMLSRGRHAIALTTGVRYLTSVTDVPYHIANFGYYGLDYLDQHNVTYSNKNINTAVLAFGEIGLTYAYSFRKFDYQDWSAGLTIRRLFGVSGGYVFADEIDYMVINDSTIDVKNMTAELGYSIPLNYDNNDFPYGPWIKGGGWGFDLGVSYQQKLLSYQKRRITKLCRQKYSDYIFKAGVSLLDIGFVKFTNNASKYAYEDVSEYWMNVDTVTYTNMNNLMESLSDVFYDDPNAAHRGNEISVFLPAAVSLQFDYRVMKGWYAGAVFIHSIPMSKSMVYRPTQLMIAPRYESPLFEASLPVSLYEWRYPRVGLSFRYQFLTFGTDNLAWLLGVSDFTGLDFYFSIKVNFSKGHCGRGKALPCENDEYGMYRKQSFK